MIADTASWAVACLVLIAACGILSYIAIRRGRKVAELRRELRAMEGWWTCDACGKEFPPEEEKSGHECDLCHECLSQQREENQCPK